MYIIIIVSNIIEGKKIDSRIGLSRSSEARGDMKLNLLLRISSRDIKGITHLYIYRTVLQEMLVKYLSPYSSVEKQPIYIKASIVFKQKSSIELVQWTLYEAS